METYRGRALNAWNAGADGIYMFNFFDPLSRLWRELGDPTVLRMRSRNYFASVLGAGSMPVPHQKLIHVPTLNPAAPISTTGKEQIEFLIGEDVAESKPKPGITLHLRVKNPAVPMRMSLNGTELPKANANADWLDVPLQASMLRGGTNSLAFDAAASLKKPMSLLDLYVSILP